MLWEDGSSAVTPVHRRGKGNASQGWEQTRLQARALKRFGLYDAGTQAFQT
jgi:hypothetical protein